MSTPSPPIIDKHIHRDGDEEADTSSDANGDADGDNRLVDTVDERESGTNEERSIKMYTLLLLLLSDFSHVQLCATP